LEYWHCNFTFPQYC